MIRALLRAKPLVRRRYREGEFPLGSIGIPMNFVQTFRDAVYAYENAKGGLGGDWDPRISSDSINYLTIGEIAVTASAYDDPLPNDIFLYLIALAPRGHKAFPQTFAAAGILLKTMYDDHIKAIPRRRVELGRAR
jgi:hypothetical protein